MKNIVDLNVDEIENILGYISNGFDKQLRPLIEGLINTATHQVIYGNEREINVDKLRGVLYGLNEVLGLEQVLRSQLDNIKQNK